MASNASPPLLPPATRLGGYEIIGLVGRGGMGEVYRARQLSMQREVALKVLSPRLAQQDPAFADQFVAEARAAGKLNHPNIVGVHDVSQAPAPEGSGIAPGTAVHYFSMEFIDGETVKDVIDRQGAVDLLTVGKVMTAMAEALAFAEAHKILHRDIKPDNIMLTSTGLVKLADLGLALQADSAEAVAGSKDEQGRGKVMGTPLYMAPEQARAHPLDHRADQYALGATLFHMLTGRPPFQGDTSKAIMRAHCFEPVPDPNEVNPEVSPPWSDLCQRMMAKTPDERFDDAIALRAAVKAAIRWHPGAVSDDSPRERSVPWVGILVASGAVLLALWIFVLRAPAAPAKPSQAVLIPAPTPAPDPGAAARDRAKHVLATLPDEQAPALAIIEQLLGDPAMAPAKELLLARRELVRGAAEERRRNVLRAAAEAIETRLAAGQLGDARDGFAKLPDEPWLSERRTLLADHLAAAEGVVETRLSEAIDGANDGAACDKVHEDIVRSELPAKRKDGLAGKLLQRRSTLAAKAPPKMQKADSATLWRELGERCELLRGTLPYSALSEALQTSARNFADADRAHVEQLANMVALAQQTEVALRLHIGQKTPRVECRFGNRAGVFMLTRLEKDWIGFRLVDVPAESRTDRAAAVLPWAQLLNAATAGQTDGPRMAAAFLWFWHDEAARDALAKLKDDPFARAAAAYERQTSPIDIAGEVRRGSGGQISVSYPFAERNEPEFLTAWVGAGAELNGKGLRWSNPALITTKTEADLPMLRWKGALLPPVTLEATMQPESGSEVVLLGLSSGTVTVRVGLNVNGQGFFLATKADGSGTYEAIKGNLLVEFKPSELSRIRLSVDAKGKVSATLNDKALGSDRELSFPPDAKLYPVIQGRGVKRGTGVVIGSLTVSGKP